MRRPWTVLLLLAARALPGQERLAEVVFMKPDPADKAVPPLYTRALDDVEPREWLKIPSARMALELYARAWDVADRRGLAKKQPKTYYVALVPDGNHPAIGFRLRGASGIKGFEEAAYIKLDPNEDFFRSTLLHETGHIAMAMISSGKGVEDTGIASLPHSNAALTDRNTAFQEGFGIHLETLAAHLISEPGMRNRYRHEQFLLGPAAGRKSEYSRQAADLMTFAQVVGRYYDIRENSFAFDTAVTAPDYLRLQYEKSRDFASLRNANQLLQSEGFYASFFFTLMARGDGLPALDMVRQRQVRMLDALAEMYATHMVERDTPYLLYFVESYAKLFPAEKDEVADVLLDLSHGVLVDAKARGIWRDYYLAALRLDLKKVKSGEVEKVREGWRQMVRTTPEVLYSRLGPQIRCAVPSVKVGLVAFGEEVRLSFDVNTAQRGVLRMIPGIEEVEVLRWLETRETQPFQSVDDFKKRAAPGAATLGKLVF